MFEPGEATAVNRFFGMRMIRGQLYEGPSWLDGRPSLVLDYSQTSRIYADNRDEIRQVAPGLFLGLMYNRTTVAARALRCTSPWKPHSEQKASSSRRPRLACRLIAADSARSCWLGREVAMPTDARRLACRPL